MNIKNWILIFILVWTSNDLFAQDFSNKGKDFWLGYGYHVRMDHAGNSDAINSQEMILYFTSDVTTNVTVEVPATGYKKSYLVTANQVTLSDPLPKTGAEDCRINDIGIFNRGIHIYSDQPIVAYAHIYNNSVSGASLLFPTTTLGREYYSINYAQNSNEDNSNSFFFVVAVEDSTTVEITPSASNKNGIAPNTPFTVTLNKGQVYSVMGTTTGNAGTDLTGSKVRTVNSGNGGCKKIAVFSGSGKIGIGGGNGGSADNLFAQALPSSAWGLKYLTAPTGTQPNNYFRICVSDPSTVVKLNGNVIPSTFLQNKFYYELKNSSPLTIPANGNSVANTTNGTFNLIEADKPITVAQYCTTQGMDGNPRATGSGGNGIGGDPEMIYLSPVEQTISKISLYSASAYNIQESYINVIIKKEGAKSFTLDGINRSSYFLTHPRDANYMYAILRVNSGTHSIYSDSGFNAIAYGFGPAESYGYNAGTNITDLYQYITLRNQYASVNFPATCKETPFKLSITLPYKPTSMVWDFNNNPNLSPNVKVTNNNPIPDSVFTKDNKTLYVFKLPDNYNFSTIGSYPVNVMVNNPTPDGCSGVQYISYDVKVYEKPKVDFSMVSSGCISDTIQFSDITNADGRSVIKWNWNFGDNTSDIIKNPLKHYTNAGKYSVKLNVITDIGCLGDTTKPITLTDAPIANFNLSDSCVLAKIQLIDASETKNGSIVKWYWDYGNGKKDTLLNTNTNPQMYNTPGPIQIKLQVESNTGCKSNILTKNVDINPLPTVNFILPNVCLPIGKASFFDSSFINNSNIGFKYIWNFGDNTTDTAKNPIHYYTTQGAYNVSLKVTSPFGCQKDTTKQLTTIFPQPKAYFSTQSEICLRTKSSFYDSSNGLGSNIVKWYWNLGNGTLDTLKNPNTIYQQAGTYSAQLTVQTDKGCFSDTATQKVIVNPLPIANVTLASPLCEKTAITINNTSTPSVGSISESYWNINKTNDVIKPDNSSITPTFDTSGIYSIQLVVKNSKGCLSDTLNSTVKINPLPKVGFIVPEICLRDASAQFADTSTISDNSQNAFTRLWNLNVSNVTPAPTLLSAMNIANPFAKYNAAANYIIGLKITSKDGCTAYKEQPFTVNGSVPVANFTLPTTNPVCSNDSVYITDKSKVDFGKITRVVIYWDATNNPTQITIDNAPSSGNGINGKTYAHKYPNIYFPTNGTTKTIKLVAYSGLVCVDSISQQINLAASPKIQFDPIPGICNNASDVTITQAKETSGITGNFIFSGNGVSANGIVSPKLLAPGDYMIKYTFVTTGTGCIDSANQTMRIWPIPIAKFGISDTTCAQNNIRFTDTSLTKIGKITQWNWSFGDNTSAIKNNGTVFYKAYQIASLQPYNATLQVVTDSGCYSNLFQKEIIVHYLPKVNFDLPSICLPSGIGQFSNTSTIEDGKQDLFRYLWSFGDANNTATSILKNPTHQYSQIPPPNGYLVKLIVTSNNFCVDSLTKPLFNVFPQPKAAFITSANEVCMGSSIAFTDKSDGKTSAVTSWYWNFPNNDIQVLQNPKKQFTDSGTYIIKLWVDNAQGCRSDTAQKSITIQPFPHLNLGKSNIYVLEGGTIPVKPNNGGLPYYYGNNLQFLWTSNTNPTYLDSNTVAVPFSTPANSLDSVKYYLTLTGIGGCKVNDSIQVVILHTPRIPNAFSPNGDSYNQTWHIDNIESYPNAVVEVYNRYGQLVFYSNGYNNNKGWDGTYNGKPLPMGTYYYIVDPKNGRAKMSGSVTIIR